MQSDQSQSDAWLYSRKPLNIDVAGFNVSDLKGALADLEELEVNLTLVDKKISQLLKEADHSADNAIRVFSDSSS